LLLILKEHNQLTDISQLGGTGSFGRIVSSTGELQFFQLKTPNLGNNTALLHLADASTPGNPALWLLSTSLLSHNSPDALIHVKFNEAVTAIVGEEYISMPTQNAMVHRILKLERTVMVSELNTFSIAQLAYEGTVAGAWKPAETAGETVLYDEAS
jgi:virginiamycin B lyase